MTRSLASGVIDDASEINNCQKLLLDRKTIPLKANSREKQSNVI